MQNYHSSADHQCEIVGARYAPIQWALSKVVTVLGSHLSKQPASLAPYSTKSLRSTSVEQSPLYKGQLELAHRWLSWTGFTVLHYLSLHLRCTCTVLYVRGLGHVLKGHIPLYMITVRENGSTIQVQYISRAVAA